MNLLFERESVLRVSARNGLSCVNAVSRSYFLDAIANRFDHSCGIRARRVGKRRFDGVGASPDISVIGIHARGMDAHENLTGGRLRRWNLFKL